MAGAIPTLPVTDQASMLYEFNYPGIENPDAHLF